MPSKSLPSLVCLLTLGFAISSPARAQGSLPDWLAPHIGAADGQIAPLVLRRARALYLRKTQAGEVKIPAISPWTPPAQRFRRRAAGQAL